jgi:uncharacterized membrane protein
MSHPHESNGRKGATPKERDAFMDLLVGYILRGGLVLSMLLLAGGIFWRWLNTGSFVFDCAMEGTNLYEFFLSNVSRLAQGALRPRLLISLGLIVLLATPYVRVLVSMLYFSVVERDLKYSVITAFVFAVLTYSLFLR